MVQQKHDKELTVCVCVCVCLLQVSRVEHQLSVVQQQHDKELKGKSDQLGTQFTCFTGAKAQILTQEAMQLNTSHA